MQFKNTSDVTLRTDKNTHPIRGKLHAELGNDQQHTRTPGTADERHQAITTRISHIIYLGHFLRCAKNVAIPTMQVQYLNETKGNYVRNCSAHPKPRPRSGPPPTDTASNPAHTCGLKDKKSWWRVSPSCFGGGLCGGGRARRWRRPIWG